MKRKNLFAVLSLIVSLSLPVYVLPQNQPPVVGQVTALVDTANHIINFTFTVSDQEQDTLEVLLSLSNDGGETFLCPMDSLSGDIGWPVLPGEGKQVSWRYNPDEFYIDSSVLAWYKVKVVADDRYQVDLQELADQVESLNLKNNLEAIIGIRNYAIDPEHMNNVKQLLKERLSAGNSQLLVQNFRYGSYDAENIIGMLPGQSREANLYILDGHFDTVAISPGADDNGAAVAGLLEAARILVPFHYRNSLQLIAFDLEEYNLAAAPGLSLLPCTSWMYNGFVPDDFRENRLGGLMWLLYRDPGMLGLVMDRTTAVAWEGMDLRPQSTQPVLMMDLGQVVQVDSSDYRTRSGYPPRQSVGFVGGVIHCQSQQDSSAFDLRTRTWRRTTQVGIGEIRVHTAPEDFSLAVYPNPGLEPIAFRITPAPTAGALALTIYNIRGQVVRSLQGTALHGQVAWDGLDQRGSRSCSGTYLAVMAWADQKVHRSFTLLR